MTNADKILTDIVNYKTEVMTLASEYIAESKNGESLGCKEDNLIILCGKIESLARFYNNNFDSAGNNIDPIFTCPSITLYRKYVDPNYTPVDSGIEINIIDGNE